MMLSPNDQEETWLVRRGESQSQHISDSNFNRELGSPGYSFGHEPIGVDRDYGSSRTVFTARRKGTPGKIVRRLISEYRDQVATKKQEIQQLESNIQEFESLLEELEQSEESE
ncbi:hypothetical protein [Nostoc sp.]|uniref:hypothetical protein n=1 Tax=Nostoc sp. TaxID=1180 RepID=UPI002FFBB6CD